MKWRHHKKHQCLRGHTGKHSNIPRFHISVDIQLPHNYCQVDFHGIHSKKIDFSESQGKARRHNVHIAATTHFYRTTSAATTLWICIEETPGPNWTWTTEEHDWCLSSFSPVSLINASIAPWNGLRWPFMSVLRFASSKTEAPSLNVSKTTNNLQILNL